MNFNQLKQAVQERMTKAQVKELFGDLRLTATWEKAYASITTAAETVVDTIDTISLLADNSETLDETIDAVVGAVKTAIYWVKVVCYFCYFAGKALGEWYTDNQVDAKITAKVEEIKATKAAFCQGYREGFTVPQWVAKSAKVVARINKRILEGISLMATPHGLAFVQADIAG